MISTMIDFADVLLAALLVGAMFGVWLMLNPARHAAGLYITLHQQGIRTLNTALPAFGAANVVLSIAAAVLARGESARSSLLVATAVCFLAAGLITRFRNQQINETVRTWKSDAPPANWSEVSDRWLRWHVLRLVVGVGGLSLLLAAVLRRG
jgi:Na+/phosphate symporter